MAFGEKKQEAPKALTFYLKESQYGGYFGSAGDDKAEVKLLPTGDAQLTIGGKGGTVLEGKLKEGQYGPYHMFTIDGFTWFGSETDTNWGKKYKLKQGRPVEAEQAQRAFNAEVHNTKAQAPLQAQISEADVPPFEAEGGVGPAGLAAPAGQSSGVQIKANSVAQNTTQNTPGGSEATADATGALPRTPKPRGGYKLGGK